MVQEGMVLGHKILQKGIEVDKAKIEMIEKLPPSKSMKAIRSFLGKNASLDRFFQNNKAIDQVTKERLLGGI